MTPKEASRKENKNKVWRNLYPELGCQTLTPKFSIGDNVRITKKKKTFDKGYIQRWTEEVFKISKIQLTIPVTYKITDYNGEEIHGSFYEQKLQKRIPLGNGPDIYIYIYIYVCVCVCVVCVCVCMRVCVCLHVSRFT